MLKLRTSLSTYKPLDVQEPVLPPPGSRINSIDDLKKWFPECFDIIGNFDWEESLHLKPYYVPFVDPPRCSIHIKEQVREELNKMKKFGNYSQSHRAY